MVYTDKMEKKASGYYIGKDVLLDIHHNILMNLTASHNERLIRTVKLKGTMMRLLVYLLENADNKLISNNDILVHVWDNFNLKSSSPRLWQVINLLKLKLITTGVPYDFITKSGNKGYTIRAELIMPIYYNEKIQCNT
ncbi:Uncharacterised protein [Pragia fontium]|nr:Uncharacterised protein [Pragia fontium]